MQQYLELPLELRLRQASQAMAPKYYVVKQAIIGRIDREEYRQNELIPSERQLMEMFGVSRITVRRAIDELVNESYLYRIQGKGTYVKAAKIEQSLFSITSCTQDVLNLGMTPMRRVISAREEGADKKRRRLLELGEGERVLRLERVYLADGIPINHTVTFLPVRLFPGLGGHDFAQRSLYKTLEECYEVRITKATRTVEAVLAEDDTARYLGMRPGDPVLLFECVTYGEVRGREVPIESFKCFYRTDKFKFYINQVADEASVT